MVDAGATEPAVEKIKLTFASDPPGATIFRESEEVGKAPQVLDFVKNNKEVTVQAQLPGMEGQITINPLERTDGKTITIKLKKLQGASKIIKKAGTGSSSATGHDTTTNHTGGELSNNPYAGSGTVPKK